MRLEEETVVVDSTKGEKWRTASGGALPVMLLFALAAGIARRVRRRH